MARRDGECIVLSILRTGKGTAEVLCPAFPAPCSYIRIEHQGQEVTYWDSAEWAEDPEGVMGAIMGAVREMRGYDGRK